MKFAGILNTNDQAPTQNTVFGAKSLPQKKRRALFQKERLLMQSAATHSSYYINSENACLKGARDLYIGADGHAWYIGLCFGLTILRAGFVIVLNDLQYKYGIHFLFLYFYSDCLKVIQCYVLCLDVRRFGNTFGDQFP